MLSLFLSFNNRLLFAGLYMTCGFTDVLDGYVARKTNTQSELGARLDSIADLILFVVITASIIIWMGTRALVFLPIVIGTALIRCVNLAIAACKFRSFAILHTYGNKATGFLLFMSPFFVLFQHFSVLWAVCTVAILAALEECIILLTSAKLDFNRQSIFIPEQLRQSPL